MGKILFLLLFMSYTVFGQAQKSTREIREIALSGSGYELGFQHGVLLKNEIADIVHKWRENTSRQSGKEAQQVLTDFFNYAKFDGSIKKWTPELYEEVRGIAEGSEQAFNDIMVLNLLDEFWVYLNDPGNHHCSGVGVPAMNGNPGYIAQNMDIETYTDGFQILIRLKGTGNTPEQLIITHPGLIALGGMNAKGIGACMNTLMQLKASATGLPVAFIVRRILYSTDKNELLKFIESVPHASGQNYILGIGGEVYDFEASANKVIRFDPDNPNGSIYHTNHPLVNDDMKEWFKEFNPAISGGVDPARSNSHIRLAAVQSRVYKAPKIDDALIKATLRSKDDINNPVCRPAKGGGFTFVSVIMTLTGKPFMQITAGPPDESEYKRIDFLQTDIPN